MVSVVQLNDWQVHNQGSSGQTFTSTVENAFTNKCFFFLFILSPVTHGIFDPGLFTIGVIRWAWKCVALTLDQWCSDKTRAPRVTTNPLETDLFCVAFLCIYALKVVSICLFYPVFKHLIVRMIIIDYQIIHSLSNNQWKNSLLLSLIACVVPSFRPVAVEPALVDAELCCRLIDGVFWASQPK